MEIKDIISGQVVRVKGGSISVLPANTICQAYFNMLAKKEKPFNIRQGMRTDLKQHARFRYQIPSDIKIIIN